MKIPVHIPLPYGMPIGRAIRATDGRYYSSIQQVRKSMWFEWRVKAVCEEIRDAHTS